MARRHSRTMQPARLADQSLALRLADPARPRSRRASPDAAARQRGQAGKRAAIAIRFAHGGGGAARQRCAFGAIIEA